MYSKKTNGRHLLRAVVLCKKPTSGANSTFPLYSHCYGIEICMNTLGKVMEGPRNTRRSIRNSQGDSRGCEGPTFAVLSRTVPSSRRRTGWWKTGVCCDATRSKKNRVAATLPRARRAAAAAVGQKAPGADRRTGQHSQHQTGTQRFGSVFRLSISNMSIFCTPLSLRGGFTRLINT